jgi:TolA-binding protein
MTQDIERSIDEAAAALREETARPASELEAARTRAKILATHRAQRDRGSRGAVWLAAAAALMIMLGGSTAWAYWTGRLETWMGAAPAATEVQRPAPVPTTTTLHVPTAPITAIAPEPVAPSDTVHEVSIPADVVATEEEPTVVVGEPERTPVDPRERAAYRAAHTLHFEAHDPTHAIEAWDSYLAGYPSGRFALEARYNRALCLVRLGRTSEAREALGPFVAGTHGGYRQREATELVQAIDAE